MKNQAGFSLKSLIITSIIVMGVLTEIIVFLTSYYYRGFALDSQTEALRQILELQTKDIISKLEVNARELGQSLQQDARFKEAMAAKDLPRLTEILDSEFRQYFVTVGVLKLSNLRVFDNLFDYVVHVNDTNLNADTYRDAHCGDLLEHAGQRTGAERLKSIGTTCLIGSHFHIAELIPLGGLFVNGYLEILADPAYSLQSLEQALGLPVKIMDKNHNILYQSISWPANTGEQSGIIASLPLVTGDNITGISIAIHQPILELERRIHQTRNTVLLLALTSTITFIAIILLILRRLTFMPLQQLESNIRLISLTRGNLGNTLQVRGTSEIRMLTQGFNDMIKALQESYTTLDGVNRELVQHRDHLEDLVIKRTADLEHARDAALQASRTKSQFLANMSHELRTPLNAIIGYSEMVMEDLDPDIAQNHLIDVQKIHNAGKHLLELINDVLDLSKIEAGRMELLIEPIDIQQLIANINATVHPLIIKNQNTLRINCPVDIGHMVADSSKLRQALLNLLSNASKFTESGIISLDIMRYNELGTDYVSFAVTDNGIGIARDRLTKLFKAFSQGDASTTRRYGGTGLGLVLSQHFCRMMGGDISVQSAIDHGSTFTIFLPAEVPPHLVAQARALVHRPAEQALSETTCLVAESEQSPTGDTELKKRTRVLVVDDDPVMRDLLTRHLEREGLETTSADSGATGIATARELLPDAIVLDILMPEMDGWTVLSQLKQDHELQHIPVILVTMVEERQTGYALGASDYITKPVDKTKLLSTIKRLAKPNIQGPVLVVEDDPDIRSMVIRMLTQEGLATTAAGNGIEALNSMRDTVPALVLLDLMMPEMDGFEFITEMRRCPQWHQIPVIVLTAMELTAQEKHMLRHGAQHIIRKGACSTKELVSLVEDTIRRYTGLPNT